MGVLKKLISAINPRFNDYTLAATLAFLVGITVIGGVAAMLIQSLQPVESVRTEVHWSTNNGDWQVQKYYISSIYEKPPGMSEDIERTVDMCILWAGIDILDGANFQVIQRCVLKSSVVRGWPYNPHRLTMIAATLLAY